MIKEYKAVLTIGKEGEKLDFMSKGSRQVEYTFTKGMFSARVDKKQWIQATASFRSALEMMASVEKLISAKHIPCHTTCYGAAGMIPVFRKYGKVMEEVKVPTVPNGLLELVM